MMSNKKEVATLLLMSPMGAQVESAPATPLCFPQSFPGLSAQFTRAGFVF